MDRKNDWLLNRRSFMKAASVAGASLTATSMMPDEFVQVAEAATEPKPGVQQLLSACPYCGVGCGTLIQVENGKIVGMVPDKEHPTNKGIQCIKGLNAHEPGYIDRLTDVLVRKDMSDPLRGHVSSTKGRFDDDVWNVVPYEEAEEMVADKIAEIIKAKGGNAVGLNGSGQLTMEAQWIENILMKGIIQSNSIEANARMCMTSAVTGYFATYGSDTPPTCYDDAELADMILFFGHNAREAHPILFWRVADHKKAKDIPTVVFDPRRTGTVSGLEDINPRNSFHMQTLNGDISYLNAIAYVILEKHPDAVAWDFLKENVNGWEKYVAGVKARYSPAQVVEHLAILDEGRITVADIENVAKLFAEASIKGRKRGRGGVLTYWGIGYNQMLHGQHNTISIVNLHLLTGNVGRPGCGTHSQTGQPNAMSERLMGGLTGRLPFNMPLKDEAWRDHIAQSWRIPASRLKETATLKNDGMIIGMMERGLKDDLLAMFWMYTTHVHLPDLLTLVRPAMTKMFTITQDIYRHAPNLLYSDVVFPAATWGEWWGGTYIQSERRVYVCDGTANPPPNCRPDMDMAIDKCKGMCKRLGLDPDTVIPYKRKANGMYDPEEIFRDICRASKGSDSDLSGLLTAEQETGKSPYQIIRDVRGVQWPAPTAESALAGGTARRYMGQEKWTGKPYGNFRQPDGRAKMKLCEQNYDRLKEITTKLMEFGVKPDHYLIDHLDLLKIARDNALVPELPDLEHRDTAPEDLPEGVYPFWLGLGIVYEHFHTAKTIRGATTLKLVPEQYVEINEADAELYGIEDGDKIRVTTRRGSYEGRASIGTDSSVKPARSELPRGYLFSPWNLSVADSADPKHNKWLVNGVSHRAWDPVSGQVDFKKLAARIEKIA